ncbi:MAG: MBL fold metallo-hydrolase [Pseudomonadota bacterium]
MRAFCFALCILAAPVVAQDRIPSHCIALSEVAPGSEYVHQATFREAVQPEEVRIIYIDHAMFLIQGQGGTDVVTDYAGFVGNVDWLPDVVTMNNAHSTHWTAFPDPDIPQALEGWADEDGARAHYLEMGDMLIRNVHTDTRRGGFGDGTNITPNGNSIFVFEVAGLCIGHLGHLHQEPTDAQYAALGRVDVVMAAVDGGLTLDHPTLLRVMDRLRSSVVIPMHWFGRQTLDAFVAEMEESGYEVERPGAVPLTLSLSTLPSQPTVIVLEPRFLSETE